MLSLLLMLAAPQATTPLTVVPPPPPPAIRNFGRSPFPCRTETTAVVQPVAPGGGLMWRQGDPPVGHYRLLDRYVDGCSVPLLVTDRVPGSNAVGREAAPAPSGDRAPRD